MIAALQSLFRLRLALVNGAAALGGYLLFPARVDLAAVCALFTAVVLLAAAGSALNQVWERDLDRQMQRTCRRPLPTGRLARRTAVLLAAGCLASGATLLAFFGGPLPALLGLAVIVWYLAVYTPLKRRTQFALAVGAVCGAAAPVIGWCFAGGSPADFRVVVLAGVLYLWQVPHFWLLQQRHAEDYRRAGIPLFAPAAGGRGAASLCRLWLAAMLAAAMMLPAFGVLSGSAALWGAVFCVPLLLTACKRSEPALFVCINLFPVLLTLALFVGR